MIGGSVSVRCGAMDFYGEVLRELVVALGAALLVANVAVLVRRRRDRDAAVQRTVARSRPGSPVRGYGRSNSTDLAVAPVGRSVLYALIGVVVMVWGIASIAAG